MAATGAPQRDARAPAPARGARGPATPARAEIPASVLQMQRAAGNRATSSLMCGPGSTTPAVQRHSSWEHKLLGDAKPENLAKMGAWQGLIEQTGKGAQASGRVVIEGVGPVEKGDVLHVLVQEMQRLKEWQTAPPTAAATDDIMARTTTDPKFEVVVVRLPGAPGKPGLLITYGELNTLADYYGDLATMRTAEPEHRRVLVQSVRKESFLRLKLIYDQLRASLTAAEKQSGSVKAATAAFATGKLGGTTFKGAAKPNFISGIAGQADLLAGDKPLIGLGTGATGGTNKYGATLARNACHFVPESWHAWANYHDQARALAEESFALYAEIRAEQAGLAAATLTGAAGAARRRVVEQKIAGKKALASEKANDALLANGFGDHYLQDSYASGHMINKTQIMQWYVQFIDKTNGWDYFKDKNWRKVQQMAYRQNLADPGQYAKAGVKGYDPQNAAPSKARDPQSVESHVAGDWHARFTALGLQVPGSLRDPASDTRKVIEWWQTQLANGIGARELGGTQLKASHVADRALEVAMIRLIVDGIVRTDEDVVVRGDYMSWDDAAIARGTFRDFAGCTFVLRENYIPKGKEKIRKFKAAVAASRGPGGDDSGYQKMAASVTYGDYLEFMKSGFIQKSTNALHDTFCSRGLSVAAGAGGEVFKVYGDDSMLNAESSKGVEHSGITANRSRDAVLNILNTGADQGLSAASILDRLPSHVKFDVSDGAGGVAAVTTDIAAWHNSAEAGYLHAECDAKVFPAMSWSLLQKMVPGAAGSDLGKISQDEGVHSGDAF